MSLLTLPDEALSEIVRHLSRADRSSLRLVHPSLAHFLRASNDALWRHLFVTRFANRLSQPPLHHSAARLLCELHDIADDYLIHRALPTVKLHVNADDDHDHASSRVSPPFIWHSRSQQRLYVSRAHRLTTVHTRHWKAVYDVQLPGRAACIHADEHAVAVGLHDGAVLLHTHDDGHRYLKTHKRAVSCVRLHPQLVVSASDDTTIRLRNRHTRRSVATLRGHGTRIRHMHLLNETQLLTCGHSDQRVKLWDLQRHTCLSTARLQAPITHSAQYNGLMYVLAAHAVHVLDPRQGLSNTAALLTLPRARGWRAPIGAMAVGTDGSLGVTVGSGGVGVWDARGRWEATPFGWPLRWEARPNRLLNALYVGRGVLVAGGGAKELLTFSRCGSYEGVVAEKEARRAAVSYVDFAEGRLLVAGADGAVERADAAAATVDWDAVHRVFEEEHAPRRSLWHTSLPRAPYPPLCAERDDGLR